MSPGDQGRTGGRPGREPRREADPRRDADPPRDADPRRDVDPRRDADPRRIADSGRDAVAPAGSPRVGLDQPIERVRSSGPTRPIAVAALVVALLAVVIWQPWGRTGALATSTSPSGPIADAGRPSASTATGPGGPSASLTAAPEVGRSLLDDEWTIVAFLAQDAPTEPTGRLTVLQQQLGYAEAPLERPDHPDAACRASGGFREAGAAHLPTDRVRFLGVTFPGMSAGASVSASSLGRGGPVLAQLPLLVVPAADRPGAQPYVVSTAGVGGAVLFGPVRSTVEPAASGATGSAATWTWPTGTYRFAVQLPGSTGARYLYACIGS